MKLLAALGILAVCAFWGYAKSYALCARATALSAFCEETPQLLLRMEYQTLPLSRLAAGMGERGTLLAPFWEAFGAGLAEAGVEEAWRAALADKGPYGLTEGDRGLLLGLGGALASLGEAGRKQAANHILQETALALEALRKEQSRKGNLYGTLGLLFGLAAAILII